MENIEIKTKDADEAAFFWTQTDFELSDTEIVDGFRKKVLWFVFTSTLTEEQINALKNDYRNGKTLVEPKQYANKRAEIKGIIREKLFS